MLRIPLIDINVGTQNPYNRDACLGKTLGLISGGSRILDAGAGELKYERFCSHLDYVSQDFGKYDGKGDISGLQMESWDNSKLDIISDIISIPEPDKSFDAIMCVEVFEHIPEPIKAIQEFSRLIKPGGHLIVTAPFCSMTHFSPYHYYTGFNSYFFQTHFQEHGFDILDIDRNGNYFEYLALEIRRVQKISERYANENTTFIEKIAKNIVLKMLQRFSNKGNSSNELLCWGYHILARKI